MSLHIGLNEMFVLLTFFLSFIYILIDVRRKKRTILYILLPIFLGPVGLATYLLIHLRDFLKP